MNSKLSFIFIFLIFPIQFALGQHFFCKNFNINDGLPDNHIQDIFKDSRGFLWIGTKAGLARFDGKNFKIYTSLEGLAGDDIYSITEDNSGSIWVACYDGGLSKLDGDQIISYTNEPLLDSKKITEVYFSGNYDLLFIVTESAIIKYNGIRFTQLKEITNANYNLIQVSHFLEYDSSLYIFTNSNGVLIYDLESENLKRLPSKHIFNSNLIQSAFISSFGDTLINYNRSNLKISSKNKDANYNFVGQVKKFVEDSDSNIWFTTANNSYAKYGELYKYKNEEIEEFRKYLNLESENITSLEYDPKENILWIGTVEHGIYLYPKFNFLYIEAKQFNLPDLDVVDLKIDSLNNIWIGTKKNLIIKSAENKIDVLKFEQFQFEFKKFKQNQIKNKYRYLTDPNGSYDKYQNLIQTGKYKFTNPYQRIINNRISIIPERSLYKPLKYDILINKELKELNNIISDRFGNIWIGSNVGLYKVNKRSKTIKYFDLEGTSFSSFLFGLNNELYASNWNELLIYPDVENNSNYSIYNYYNDKGPININHIKLNNKNVYFTSSDHGLFILHENKFYSTYDKKDLDIQSINDICFDSFGNIILAGNNGKIYITEFVEDTIHIKFELSRKNEITGSSIRFLNCSKNNYLIAGTNTGINVIDLIKLYETGSFSLEAFDNAKGYIDYSGNECVIDSNNQVWIGTKNQIIKFNLNQLNEINDDHINFFIKAIEVNNNSLNLNDLGNVDHRTNVPKSTIELAYYKNSISFYFDVINFIDPDKIFFCSKLEGLQEEWTKETKERKVIFQNLKPGVYKLKIKAFDKNNTNNNRELDLSFNILRPTWAKWWFISATMIFILLSIWSIIILRTRNIKKKERQRSELLERVTEFEMKALRSQMNPHFIFNAINSIQNYILDNDVDAALNYLSDFAKIIRITLDNVSKKQITLDDELNYLKYYISLEQMRFNKSFEINITLPKEHNSRTILIPPMIIQPFVENAIKHGFVYKKEGAMIHLKFEIIPEEILKCTIEDNGIGRKKSKELNKNSKTHKSKGIFITNERLSLLNQTERRKGYKINTIDLYDEFNFPCGTRVEIDIPI